MDSVLVTGAGGFIGSHVVRRFLAGGQEVHALVRAEGKAERLAGLEGLRFWTGDLLDKAALERCMQGAQPVRILHCAGTSRARHSSGWEPVREAQRANFEGLVNLLEAAAESGSAVRSFVRLGGLEEYGAGPAPFVETQREAPRSAYSASQVAGTHLLQSLQTSLPFPAVTLRPTLIYGPAQSTDFLIPSLIESLLAGRPFALSQGLQRRDLLHVDDLVTAMLTASNSSGLGGQVINVATGIAPTIRTVARTIGRMLGRTDLLKFGELPERPNDTADLRGDGSKARELLGWSPTILLVRGLDQTIKWHRSMLTGRAA